MTDEEAKWRVDAIEKLLNERKRMGRTPITQFSPPGFPKADIFFKNETTTATRTLKHRFAWALLVWAIGEGKVTSKTSAVYDSTSGNTGSAEAYMCRLVNIPYYAVVADNLEQEKVKQIESFGGKIIKVPVSLRNAQAKSLAAKNNGFYMNQFGNAERAEEYHESGNFDFESSNVLHEILHQFREQGRKVIVPDYFVHSAGTGGTISSVGRYIARYAAPTKVLLADSQYSLFYDYVIENKFTNQSGKGIWTPPGIAGIGYGYDIEPVLYGETTSLTRQVIHEAMKMPDIATVAAMRILDEMGYNVGPSTSLNFLVSLYKAYQMKLRGLPKLHRLTIVTLANDPGDFYLSTYMNNDWVEKSFKSFGGVVGMECWKKLINESIQTGSDFYSKGLDVCPGNFS
uniref:PALP domain-containing protein n=2 Tax=Caenorhabditis japonica TaxID=281687 RepID=A0A8R1DWH6_CAEJA